MSGAHTPGPWVIRYRTGHGGLIRCYRVGPVELAEAPHGGICLYDDATSNNPHPEGEQEANARLIAAAPDLLVALELLLNDYVRLAEESGCDLIGSNWDPEVARARAALAKARGQ